MKHAVKRIHFVAKGGVPTKYGACFGEAGA